MKKLFIPFLCESVCDTYPEHPAHGCDRCSRSRRCVRLAQVVGKYLPYQKLSPSPGTKLIILTAYTRSRMSRWDAVTPGRPFSFPWGSLVWSHPHPSVPVNYKNALLPRTTTATGPRGVGTDGDGGGGHP